MQHSQIKSRKRDTLKFEYFEEMEQFQNLSVIKKALNVIKQESTSQTVGYYDLPSTQQETLAQVGQFCAENKEMLSATQTIVLIGIGGSSLGTKALHSALKHTKQESKNIIFLENADPIEIQNNLRGIDKQRSIFCVVSKSGTTIETISIFKFIIAEFEIDFTKDAQRILIITDKNSALCNFGAKYGIRRFYIPSNVGGRFSIMSAVGIVPLYLAGYDMRQFLIAAQQEFKDFWGNPENKILKCACYLYANRHNLTTTILFSYSSLLEDFTKWFVQLWGESLGKVNIHNEHVGLTPIGLIGSVDQHSFLQLIMEGPRNKAVLFVGIEDFENELRIPLINLAHLEQTDFINGHLFATLINSQCEATFESLKNNQVPSQKITLQKLDETTLAKAFVYFELLTSCVGAMLEINTYDQPGVEIGKKILSKKFQSS